MNPEKIKQIVEIHTAKYLFNDYEKRSLQRYFIKEFCPWLPLRYIGNLTGVKDHTPVISSIKAVNKLSKYKDIKWVLSEVLTAGI